jgi:hypothetical protein
MSLIAMTSTAIRRAILATLVFAIAFPTLMRATLGCAMASMQLDQDACCAGANCPQTASLGHQCCKATPSSDSAGVASATSTGAPPCRLSAARIPVSITSAPAYRVEVPSNRATPSAVFLDRLCSLQI